MLKYKILAGNESIHSITLYSYTESDAEEAAAALAMAGFSAEVYCNGEILHEFFPS